MTKLRSTRNAHLGSAAFFVATALCWTVSVRSAAAAAIKVACIGEHTTHSTEFAATDRESQPANKQEYPAMLQTLLGTGYDVRNFGDCCGSVLQGYTVQETHPYILGSNAGGGPGYKESLAFLPDIVIIGSWGRHDWGMDMAAAEVWSVAAFQQDYDDLLQRYRALPTHPKIFVSLPIPILNGQGDVADKGVTTSSMLPIFRTIAAKYDLPIIDLYTPFLNHMELFKQPPGAHSEGEHVTDEGLRVIANTVFAAMTSASDAGTSGPTMGSDASSGARDASIPSEAAMGAGGSAASGGDGGAAGQEAAGNEAGSSSMPVTTGSAGSSSSDATPPSGSGCSCSLVRREGSTTKMIMLIMGLAIAVERRRRAVF